MCLIFRKLATSPILQTRARLKVTECAQAFTFTISILIGIFFVDELYGDWDYWGDRTLDLTTFICFSIYCGWFAAICLIYTVIMLGMVLCGKTKKIMDIIKEVNYRQDPLENNFDALMDQQLAQAMMVEDIVQP